MYFTTPVSAEFQVIVDQTMQTSKDLLYYRQEFAHGAQNHFETDHPLCLHGGRA